MSKAFCQSSSIMYANFDLVDTKIYMCNCRFVSVQIIKVDDIELTMGELYTNLRVCQALEVKNGCSLGHSLRRF